MPFYIHRRKHRHENDDPGCSAMLFLMTLLGVSAVAYYSTIILLGLGLLYSLVISMMSIIKALREEWYSYLYYEDKNKNVPPGMYRNYFFGPGFFQIKSIIKFSYKMQIEELKKLNTLRKRDFKLFLNICKWVFFIIAWVCTMLFGFIWKLLFATFLSIGIYIGMFFFFIYYSLHWMLDRVVLLVNSIHSRCPNCKKISIVPIFICQDCGAEHTNLTPGPYGLFIRICPCGAELPTTFLSGRSKLPANCPLCAAELAASDAKQFGLQLVGGVGSGKTTFLASFSYKYFDYLKARGISYRRFPVKDFIELERWYKEGISEATSERNARAYSIVLDTDKKVKTQFTIYDIAGESFYRGYSIQQQQFKYCEGIIFLIDPTAKENIANDVISKFTAKLKEIRGKHTTSISNVPISVVISKADIYENEIGKSAFKSNIDPEKNNICRDFLLKYNFGNVVNIIESEYKKVQYFSISAIGREPVVNQAYRPWGVLEPVLWLIK